MVGKDIDTARTASRRAVTRASVMISLLIVVAALLSACGGSGGAGQGHTVINQPAETDTTAPGSEGICQP